MSNNRWLDNENAVHMRSGIQLGCKNEWSWLFAERSMGLLEKAMATHSGVLAWRIPGAGEPGGLPSRGSCRVGHDWSDLAAAAAAGEQIQPGVIMFMPIASPLCVVGGVQLADCSVMGFLPLLLLVCMLASCGFISSFLQIWEGWNVSWSVSVFNWLFC